MAQCPLQVMSLAPALRRGNGLYSVASSSAWLPPQLPRTTL